MNVFLVWILLMVDFDFFNINFHGFRFGQAEQLQGSAEFSVITGAWSLKEVEKDKRGIITADVPLERSAGMNG